MVSEGKFISRISCVGIKVVNQFAPLLELLAFVLLNHGFRIYDSESDPFFFLKSGLL
jgi:hypothetical protein